MTLLKLQGLVMKLLATASFLRLIATFLIAAMLHVPPGLQAKKT
jgi:hypothetical protein